MVYLCKEYTNFLINNIEICTKININYTSNNITIILKRYYCTIYDMKMYKYTARLWLNLSYQTILRVLFLQCYNNNPMSVCFDIITFLNISIQINILQLLVDQPDQVI